MNSFGRTDLPKESSFLHHIFWCCHSSTRTTQVVQSCWITADDIDVTCIEDLFCCWVVHRTLCFSFSAESEQQTVACHHQCLFWRTNRLRNGQWGSIWLAHCQDWHGWWHQCLSMMHVTCCCKQKLAISRVHFGAPTDYEVANEVASDWLTVKIDMTAGSSVHHWCMWHFANLIPVWHMPSTWC